MRLQLCLLLSIFPLINSASGSCGRRDDFTCLEPEFQRMFNSCKSPSSSYTSQQLEAARFSARDRGNQFCQTIGYSHTGARARTCALFHEVDKCFTERIRLQAPAVRIQPNESARLVAISNTCATSRDRTFLINSRVFLVQFLNTNCQSVSASQELAGICRSARDASACILGSIDRLGEVNSDERSSGKDTPSTGRSNPSTGSGTTPQ